MISKTTLLLLFICLLCQSCFLIKVPVDVQSKAVADTVQVMHFIVSPAVRNNIPDSLLEKFKQPSYEAVSWISSQAAKSRVNINFTEHWATDTAGKTNFVYKLPTRNLSLLLSGRSHFEKWAKEKFTSKRLEKVLAWRKEFASHLYRNAGDSAVKKLLQDHLDGQMEQLHPNAVFVFHILKAKKQMVLGFYSRGSLFTGDNSSAVIAHEMLHHLGAHDLYIHKFWIGKRRHLVRKKLENEIMDFKQDRKNSCEHYYISDYTRYCIGWTKELQPTYRPLLKQNLMALIFFKLLLSGQAH